MFERMEITEAIYVGGAPSKNTQRAEYDCASFVSNQKVGGSALTSNPKKGRAGKRKKSDVGHPSNAPTGAKKTCMLHVPGHSSDEWKLLKYYSKNYIAQRPFKYKEACSGGNKCANIAKINKATQEVNRMKYHDEPIPKKKKVRNQKKNPKSDQANAEQSEDGRIYGILASYFAEISREFQHFQNISAIFDWKREKHGNVRKRYMIFA